MCGIAGILAWNDASIDEPLQAMMDAMVYRGPDDSGKFCEHSNGAVIGFGHRRLSIIDLSKAGHQPMTDPATGAVMIYNGEIYNFQSLRRELEAKGCRFSGQSDTEVLLQALVADGERCLEKLCGMFTLAFYDRRRHRLLLARDPMGIKPMYVARVPGMLLFASEIGAMLASGLVPRQVDQRAVAGFLAYGAVQEPDTIVQNVKAFPPGCWQWIDLGSSSDMASSPPQRFWEVPEPQDMSEDDAIKQYQNIFDRVVDEHLVSDVPLAVLLSSGLDSTVLAGLAARHASDLRTFTIGFSDHPDLDESPLAEETARLIKATHTTVSVTEADCQTLVKDWIESLDQPSIDGLNVYLISKFIAQHGITVVLSGLGGDEMFGGYPSFRDVPRLMRVCRAARWLPRRSRSALAKLAGIGRSDAVRQKMADIAGSDGDVVSLCLHRRRTMSNRQMAGMGMDARQLDLHGLYVPMAAMDRIKVRPSDPLWMVSQVESRFYQGNMLLRDSDTNGMQHSLEIRVPFLDRRILDLAFSIPDHLKLPFGRADKHLTRKAFSPMLRPELTERRKTGFVLPIGRWMRGPLAEMCEAGLQRLKSSDLVEPRGVDAVWQAFEANPESPIWSRAWELCVLGIYLKQNNLDG